MPVLNEADYIESAVSAILSQDYPAAQEVVLALGPSSDNTISIAERLASLDERITLVRNPRRDIPVGLNIAIRQAAHPIIIRVDAHSELSPGYTLKAVEFLIDTQAANVGGVMRAAGKTPVQRAIAGGYNSPIGLGGGTYHYSDTPHEAESAYLGVFFKDTFERVGGFDEGIRRGEDWEFNLRVRKSGGSVWFSPQLSVTYWPRSSYRALIQQFFATGSWRASLVKKYPTEHPWRFFIPALFVIALIGACVTGTLHLMGIISNDAWWPWILYAAPAAHLILVGVASARMREPQGLWERMLSVIAVFLMHVAWGLGFLWGICFGSHNIVDKSRAD